MFFESSVWPNKFSCDFFFSNHSEPKKKIYNCREPEKDCDIGFFNHLNPQSTMKIRNDPMAPGAVGKGRQ